MKFFERNIEIGIVLLIGLFVLGIVYFQSFLKTGEFKSPEISYEMPRPKSSYNGDFDLEGREIERNLKNPFEKKEKLAPQNVATNKPVTPVKAQQPNAAAKKVEDKKQEKKSGVEVRVVGDDKKHSDNDFFGGSSPGSNKNSVGGRVIAANDTKKSDVDQNKKENELSEQQWRDLVLNHPNNDTVTKLIQAYLKKEIDNDVYFKIVTELIESRDETVQTLGAYAMSVLPTLNGFKYMAENYTKLNPKAQKYAENYLLTFSQPTKSGVLEQALKSADPLMIETAAKVVVDSYKRVKSGNTLFGISTRDISAASTKYDTSYFDKFLQIIEELKSSSNPSIVSIANTTLVSIAGI